jgi:hypothetical protein
MVTYRICNFAFESNLPFAELCEIRNPRPEFRFMLGRSSATQSGTCEWLNTWNLPDDTPWLLLGKQENRYLLRFPDMADFSVSQDGREVHCELGPGIPVETLRHLFLDQVMPLLLSRKGQLVLHGSAVSTSKGAIAFVGRTGSGKSTLACSFSEKGIAVLTDDCLLVREELGCLTAVPSYPGVRLWPETADAILGERRNWADVAHYTKKKRLDGNGGIRFCNRPARLSRIFFLPQPQEAERATETRIEPLSPRDAMVELVKYTYLMDVTDRSWLRSEFERLGRVALQPLFYRLIFPRDLSQLAKVRQAILSDQAAN